MNPWRIWITLTIAVGLGIGALGLDRWVETTQIPPLQTLTSPEVRDRNDRLLRAYPVADGIWRLSVAPKDVDADYIAMLLRFEDKRFYDHHGVDLQAMLRAAGQAIWHRRAVSGGSTLTMQVARLLEDGSTGTWAGKLRQLRLALALERHLTKDQILELYLTHAPFGGNIEGVRAATFAWFGNEPHRLTPAQAALLVALPQSPERRRPDRHTAAARQARDRVLQRMVWADVLTEENARIALSEPVPNAQRRFPRLAPHLADRVRAQAGNQSDSDLTLDGDLQAAVEDLARTAVTEHEDRLSVAMLVADHQTGEILAAVGSAAYRADQRQGFVDMTVALRSPGSTLKPLVYGLAFDRGLAHPETLIHDGPVTFQGYAPENFDGQFHGDIRVRRALQSSLNIPVVRLLDQLGPARLMATLRQGGASPQIPGGKPGLAVGLGGVGVSLLDLVEVYAGLAAGGQGPVLRYDRRVPSQENARMMTRQSAWHVADILRGVTPPPGAPHGVVAYKTGTSYGHRDAWAIGWDGQHVIGIWMGRADGTPVPGAFGGDLAAPLMFQVFGLTKPGFTPLPPAPLDTLQAVTADLPPPLRRFDDRFQVARPQKALRLVFPPDGAKLLRGERMTLKLRGGQAPFTVLRDGSPVLTGQQRREIDIPMTGAGFSQLVVVDQLGRSDRVTVMLQ